LSAFNTAIAAAVKTNVGVWIPVGRYYFSFRITVNGVTIRGAGPWYTILEGNDFGFLGGPFNQPPAATNVHLYDFAIFGNTRTRDDQEVSSGVGGALSSSTVQNLWIEHNKCGMWLDGPFDSLHITGVIIRNTFADGINFHFGVTNSWVEQSIIRNTGDDVLAMWPHYSGTYEKNVFQFNTLSLPVLANAVAIYGGSDNSATDNVVYDTMVEGAGLQVGTRYASLSLAGTTTLARTTILRCGSYDLYSPASKGEGAIWLFAENGIITNGNVVFENITVTDSLYAAIQFYLGQVSNVSFSNIQINGAAYVWQEKVSGSISAQGVVAKNITVAGIWNCGQTFVIQQGPGNSYPNTTKCDQ